MTYMHVCNKQSDLEHLESAYFVRMMLPDAEQIAAPYVTEEKNSVTKLLKSLPDASERSLVVVGAGPLWYRDIAREKVKQYVAVEPLADIFISKEEQEEMMKDPFVHVINTGFGDFPAEQLPAGKTVFLFHFNIISYIPHPMRVINKYCKPGDILYLSTWNTTPHAKDVRKQYFDYLNASADPSEYVIDPEKTTGLCNLRAFPFEKLNHYSSHTWVPGEITDTLIINC